MSKKNRANRRRKGSVSKLPRKHSEAPTPTKTKLRATPLQALAVELTQARLIGQNLRVRLAQQQDEISDLKKQILQLEINAEARENQLLIEKHGLPTGTYEFGKDDEGHFFEVTGEVPQIPQDEPETTVEIPELDGNDSEDDDELAGEIAKGSAGASQPAEATQPDKVPLDV